MSETISLLKTKRAFYAHVLHFSTLINFDHILNIISPFYNHFVRFNLSNQNTQGPTYIKRERERENGKTVKRK